MLFEEIEIKDIDEKKWENHPRVRVSEKETISSSDAVKIDPKAMERREFRKNKPFIPNEIGHVHVASRDAIKHFTDGIGDTNPLFRDPEYAKNTKYGRIVAPGCFLYAHQWTTTAGGFGGVHAWYSGGDWEWYKPCLEGTNLKPVIIIRDMDIKGGKKTGGKIYIDYGDVVYLNADTDEIIAKELYHNVWAEREAAGSTGKDLGIEKPKYSREDWLRILEMHDREEVRGANKRYWEDVKEGDIVGPHIMGPLTVRDMITWCMGVGTLFFRAHKIQFDYELKHPNILEFVESLGEADVPELVHIFDEYAKAIGIDRAYDYGHERMSWLCNLFTNWMGDDGFLYKMSGDLRAFNLVGDVTLLQGVVEKKYIEDGKCCVDIKAWAKNQRGQISMPENMTTIILPSREHGDVVYPKVPQSLVDEVKQARPLKELIAEGLI